MELIQKVIEGDSGEVLKGMEDCSVDTVLTDPPYGLSKYSVGVISDVLGHWLSGDLWYTRKRKGFRDEDWDGMVPTPGLWSEVYRVLKPGGTILVFSGVRTQDLMMVSLRLAGFEIKDVLMWVYGSGFPKSADIATGLDKRFGYKKAVGSIVSYGNYIFDPKYGKVHAKRRSDEARLWDGYRSHGLKPAYEPIIMGFRPNEGSYANNALKWGVSGLNIKDARVPVEGEDGEGRYPSNVIIDEVVQDEMDRFYDHTKSSIKAPTGRPVYGGSVYHTSGTIDSTYGGYNDEGGPSRFFYVVKVSSKERAMYYDGFNHHPTVKPVELIDYLVRMTRMPLPGQVYLDPFFGSGTLGVVCKRYGLNFIGIERNSEYCKIARDRIRFANGPLFGGDSYAG